MAKKKATEPEKTWESPNRVYDEDDVQKIRVASEIIDVNFNWDDTEEGRDFWFNVMQHLGRIADNIEVKLRTPNEKL